jgi:N-acetylglucosamine-6-sulfatase
MTDDQDERSVRVMDEVQQRIADRGVTYENAIATFPLCCPSRATFLTGQYAHNHGVLSNGSPDGGDEAFGSPETALPVALDEAGYRTGLIGKYLNGHRADDPIPPGWDSWRVVAGPPSSYEYELDENGKIVHYGSEPDDYHTSVYADKAVRWIERAHKVAGPFFLTVGTGAPHSEPGRPGPPPIPSPSYQGRFDREPLPRPPSFNESDVSDKPAFVRNTPRVTTEETAALRTRYRARLASLLPVDRLVKRVVSTLRATGELANTYVIFTSDNGYLMGEHRLLRGKTRLYEESLGVPLMMRGPDLPPSTTHSRLAGNIDLAPTLLDMADVEPLVEPDGSSLLEPVGDRSLLLEAWPHGDIKETSKGVRTRDYAYFEHDTGEEELYDLEADPYQLESLDDDPAYDAVEAALETGLRRLEDCAGASCR